MNEEKIKQIKEQMNTLYPKLTEEERLKNLKEHWKTLQQFKEEYDVPELPRVNEDEWKNFFVPKLIECGAIPKDKLEDGKWYVGRYRNNNIAKWNKKKISFCIGDISLVGEQMIAITLKMIMVMLYSFQ